MNAIVEVNEWFNAGMCNDLVGIIRQSGVPRIDFEIAFSPELKSEEVAAPAFRLEPRLIPMLQDASKMAKPLEPPQQEVVGRVAGLESDSVPGELDVASGPWQVKIASVDDSAKIVEVSVRLDAADYLGAYDAHGSGAFVGLIGTLTRDRGRMLEKVTEFKTL